MVLIKDLLSDRPRPGKTKSFTVEQVVQIVTHREADLFEVACESPEKSGRPISHWTPRELAEEAIKH